MNIFIPNRNTAEDQISAGFCYLLNSCPREVGDAFLNKIVELAQLERSDVGHFVKAQFIGYDYISDDAISRPDILIETTTEQQLYIEVKVDAHPDQKQILRHIETIPNKSLLLLISKHEMIFNDQALNIKNYIRPQTRSHFKWIDFEAIFNEAKSGNETQRKLISDFKVALHSKGLKSRSFEKYKGSIYENDSESEHHFLMYYSQLIKDCGWKTTKVKTEYTIRINPEKRGADLLLNSRLEPAPVINDICYFFEADCIWIWAYSKEQLHFHKSKLNTFTSQASDQLKFIEADEDELQTDGLFFAGWLVVPLEFDSQNRLNEKLAITIWTDLRAHIK